MASDKITIVTDDSFESVVLGSDKPFLLDFWATWCRPCVALTPILEELASEYEGLVRIGKIDVDSNKRVATKFQVRSIPTLLMFKSGEIVGHKVGSGNKAALDELIKKGL